MKKELKKISVVCLVSALSVMTADAAPSVRMLGGASSFAGTTGAVSAKSDTQTLRAASMKSGQTGVLKSAGVKAVNEPVTARLSLGKFLHNSGVSKGVTPTNSGSSSNAGVSSSELLSLQDRVRTVENSVDGIRTNVLGLQNHTTNTSIHVSAEEKAAWNAKQDALTAGSGITITNGVISAHGLDGSTNVTDEEKAVWNAKQNALTAGSGITIIGNTISADVYDGESVSAEEKAAWNAKQDTLTAGTGITISGNTISADVYDGESVSAEEKASWNAKQDALTAGSGITITNGVISAHNIDGTASVTVEEKASWNAKQDALSAGNGININNGVVSVDTSILPADTSDAVLDLQDRVSTTETHVANTGIHVTAEEKATWNAKQGALTAGNGINISNGEVSVDTSILPADTSAAVLDLQDRVTSTENHVADTDIHVTAEEKAIWTAKQDALTAGNGISIENGVISADVDTSLSVTDTESASGKMVSGIAVEDNVVTVTRGNVKIPVGSENAAPTATIWVE